MPCNWSSDSLQMYHFGSPIFITKKSRYVPPQVVGAVPPVPVLPNGLYGMGHCDGGFVGGLHSVPQGVQFIVSLRHQVRRLRSAWNDWLWR